MDKILTNTNLSTLQTLLAFAKLMYSECLCMKVRITCVCVSVLLTVQSVVSFIIMQKSDVNSSSDRHTVLQSIVC